MKHCCFYKCTNLATKFVTDENNYYAYCEYHNDLLILDKRIERIQVSLDEYEASKVLES